MSDIFKTKINNQWVGIPALKGEKGDKGDKGDPGPAAVQVNADWTETDTTSKAYIEHKPSLATVATSGSYNDLSNKPTIPAAQVNSDWNSVSGVSQILNKPTFTTVTISVADWNGGTTATKNVTGVTSSNNILVGGEASSMSEIINSQVYCSAQGTGTLTFTCRITPTTSVTFCIYKGM